MKFDWKFVVATIVGLAALVIPVWLWQFDLQSKALVVQLVSSTALSPQTSSIKELKISLDGIVVEQPTLSILEILNEGAKPIATSDFESSINITTSDSSKILRARIVDSTPPDLKPIIALNQQSIEIKPLLLNPRDRFTIAILTSGESPNFSAMARISAISQIQLRKTLNAMVPGPSLTTQRIMAFASALVASISAAVMAVSYGYGQSSIARIPRILFVISTLSAAILVAITFAEIARTGSKSWQFWTLFSIAVLCYYAVAVITLKSVRIRTSNAG